MRKTYRYKNLSYPVADETDVNFTVKFISDGNMGNTVINVPGPKDPEILNEGTVFIGKGKSLRKEPTIIVSVIDNLNPNEDKIIIEYLLNDQLIQRHKNSKDSEEEKRPIIILTINFPTL
jgi:hypothetical protein